jgi:hypothetical protein
MPESSCCHDKKSNNFPPPRTQNLPARLDNLQDLFGLADTLFILTTGSVGWALPTKDSNIFEERPLDD